MQELPQSRDDRWPGEIARPRSIDELMPRLKWFRSADSSTHANSLQTRPDDVFIATYPKCGTTWTQQIVHTLRSGGDMHFDEITEVVPWYESAHDIGIDINAAQQGLPRAFKTHLLPSELPSDTRHIYITRDPAKVAVSFYRFFDGWMLQAGSVTLDEFVEQMYLAGSRSGTWWGHLLEWWPLRTSERVLFLCYEDMVEDPRTAIEDIAAFCGIALTPALLETTLERTSIDFMRAHHTHFDDHLVRKYRDPAIGLPKGGLSDKVSREDSSQRIQLSQKSLDRLNARWQETIEAELGFASYEMLRDAVGTIRAAR